MVAGKAEILAELKNDLENVAEEYMFFYHVTKQEFTDTARNVANNFTFNDSRDEEGDAK